MVARTAWRITFVTVSGCEIIDRCDARTSVTWACAVLSMASCKVGGMALSMVPTTAHDGIDFYAGTPAGSVNALVAIGRWVAASTRDRAAGMSLAMQLGKALCLI